MRASPKQELHEKLGPSAVKSLEQCFREYDCVPLPRPLASEELLRKIETAEVTWTTLDPAFREEFVVLERRVLDLLRYACYSIFSFS